MGTALAKVLGDAGREVVVWNYEGDPEPIEHINHFHENKKYLPSVVLSPSVRAESDLKKALARARVVVLAVPSRVVVDQLSAAVPFLPKKAVIVDVSKGFSGLTESTTKISPTVKKWWNKRIIVSGPAVALDIAKGGFTTMSIAGKNKIDLRMAQQALTTDHLHFLPTTDVVGIKLAGSLKNIYAILLGMADGLGLSLNTKAFLVVRSIQEISLVIKKCGGKADTSYALAGLGDLVATGLSQVSRNRRFGEYLGQGLTSEEAEKKVGQVVEGVAASKEALLVARRYRLKLPLLEAVQAVVWQHGSPQALFEKILSKEYVQKTDGR